MAPISGLSQLMEAFDIRNSLGTYFECILKGQWPEWLNWTPPKHSVPDSIEFTVVVREWQMSPSHETLISPIVCPLIFA